MPDLDHLLDRLAPEVDDAASRALFDRRRAGHRRRRPAVVAGIAAALLLVVGVAAVAIAAADRDTTLQVGGDAGPTDPDGAGGAEGASPPDDDVVTTVDLPPVGEPRSVLVEDGLPIWVVHHADGSATALPALTPEVHVDDDPFGSRPVDGLWEQVDWLAFEPTPDRPAAVGTFVATGTQRQWDEWGRALPDARHAHLTGFVADVDGDQVVVRRSDRTEVPGAPVPVDGSAGAVHPAEPRVAASVEDLEPGWNLLDDREEGYDPVPRGQILTGHDGVFRTCAVQPELLAPCPDDAPSVLGLTAHTDQDVFWLGPQLVEVDGSGRIIHIVPLGGTINLHLGS